MTKGTYPASLSSNEKRDVFFSDSEAGDWYEIGKLL